ncbi:MAG TPA: DUF5615 family PIN-like protein [Aggregatilineales bacterium]|nr:DUF5615 family PIN-like protein [Aggregatilineales bacterium]
MALHPLFDENFNYVILRGLLRHNPNLDLLRVQDVGLAGVDDPTVLDWAANAGRVLFSHDVQTLVGFAYERIAAGKRMPGLFEVRRDLPLSLVIDEILLLIECSEPDEWEHQVRYLPLR